MVQVWEQEEGWEEAEVEAEWVAIAQVPAREEVVCALNANYACLMGRECLVIM
ncbi:MAG: hypothetical protein KJ995_00895 [Candidatus Omnitrophica bacterium]|nr:hypothetical protein [Candidatus Omnitrophota bacterium]MBU1656722.1 hypothetical protein [Candidatus Omnitrophota bacterium]MBU1784874.1 hypothetical protein [Candidatus Omnitrophota bacterium]MBU1850950.1 hypothetical protein [Candidatus Omnitrophota bacterium]